MLESQSSRNLIKENAVALLQSDYSEPCLVTLAEALTFPSQVESPRISSQPSAIFNCLLVFTGFKPRPIK